MIRYMRLMIFICLIVLGTMFGVIEYLHSGLPEFQTQNIGHISLSVPAPFDYTMVSSRGWIAPWKNWTLSAA